MGGGTLQLIVYGGQDIHIMGGNPEYSFFKSVFRKHTNFSMECIDQEHTGNISSTTEFTLNYDINKSGDLLYKMHLEIDFPQQDYENEQNPGTQYCNYTNNTAYSYLKDVDFYIGEQLIDSYDGKWLDIMNELNRTDGSGLDTLIRNKPAGILNGTFPPNIKTYIPFDFWFCKHPSNALPLIALQYHTITLKVGFRSIKNIINSKRNTSNNSAVLVRNTDNSPASDPLEPKIKLWINYIYLDTDERKRFAQSHHEYLIEQIQRRTLEYSKNINITLNHPIKCLYWIFQNNIATSEKNDFISIDSNENVTGSGSQWTHGNDYLNYNTHENSNPSYINGDVKYEHFKGLTIKFNGIERFKERDATYFRTIQPLESGYTFPTKLIYMYSFCLDPNSNQPSGSCNFSRIDNVSFNFSGTQQYTGYSFNLYSKNYNILRIMEGLGGLLYS